MASTLHVNYDNKPCYDILIENDYERFYSVLKDFNLSERKICIVTDSNVAFKTEELVPNIENLCKEVSVFTFPAGEASKNLDTVYELYDFLIKRNFDRNDLLLALGGGVVGDMTGFTASTYLRGIKFIQMPTSLLSQVDSSIGGKTGVDYKGYKNMVGAFYQPSLVYINLSTLKTLPKREYLSGMGEIIKHGFIKDRAYLDWLNDNMDKIKALDLPTLEYMIKRSCEIKQAVVEYDPKETLGERALLNFGHTLGHAIEKCCNFTNLHGECVSIGCVCALKISYAKGYISKEDMEYGILILKKANLPTDIKGISADSVLNATKHDKKMDSNKIKFIVLKSLGDAAIDTEITIDDMNESLEGVLL